MHAVQTGGRVHAAIVPAFQRSAVRRMPRREGWVPSVSPMRRRWSGAHGSMSGVMSHRGQRTRPQEGRARRNVRTEGMSEMTSAWWGRIAGVVPEASEADSKRSARRAQSARAGAIQGVMPPAAGLRTAVRGAWGSGAAAASGHRRASGCSSPASPVVTRREPSGRLARTGGEGNGWGMARRLRGKNRWVSSVRVKLHPERAARDCAEGRGEDRTAAGCRTPGLALGGYG